MQSGTAPDVVVVGGGITGTATAAFLAVAGARVVLVERDGLASGASGANSGVVQHPFDPVLAGLYRETMALYRDLAASSNAFAIGERPSGLLYISTAEDAARRQAAAAGAGGGPGAVGMPGRHRLPGDARCLHLRVRHARGGARGGDPVGTGGHAGDAG
jgi:glycine/D-amino acid oxidase-like deaminating enzyme